MSNPAAKQSSLSRNHVIAAIVCAVAALVLFQFVGNATRGYVRTPSLFWWWISQWLDPRAETEHGWLILAVSGWVMWRNLSIADRGLGIADWPRPEVGTRKPETASISGLRSPVLENPQSAIRDPQFPTAAVGAMLLGLVLHAIGFIAQQSRISIIALLVFTWGVLRLAGGKRWGDAAKFPLLFMVFAVPVSMLDEIGLPLRLWVTAAGERIAHAAGIDLVRSGTQLVAPDGRYHYDVAAPCSGVRSLVALAALSLLLGYLNFKSIGRRLLVLACCLPLIYLGNVLRIVAIVFAAHWGGEEWGNRVHTLMGYGVFLIVLAGILLIVGAIQRWWPEVPSDEQRRREEATDDARATRLGGGWAVAGVVVAVALAEMFLLHRLAAGPPRGLVGVVLAADGLNPVELPAFLGTEWIGQRVEVSSVEREILPADTGFSRKNYAYLADRKQDVFLSIVLSGRDRTSIHRPELCLVSQGWTIDGTVPHTFRHPALGDGGGDFAATILRVRREVSSARGKSTVPQIVAYWFVSGDAVVGSHWQRFLHDAWNRVARARADRWAYVLMQTDANDGEASALARMQAVLDRTLPVFQKPLELRR